MADRRFSIEGRTLRMARAGTRVVVGERLGEGGQGVVHAVQVGNAAYAVKWYRTVPKPDELRESIGKLIDHGRPPHPSFVWPVDLVDSDEVPGFGYLMPRLEPAFESLGGLLWRQAQPSFRTIISIARNLVSAFDSLHGEGLCYRDINFGNLWVDPRTARVAIIDNDNVGPDEAEQFVWGTLRFMAPEVVRQEKFPSARTDLHSLAVFLFYLFAHGHPLEGSRTESAQSWATSAESESQLAVRAFGLEPLFVFDPADDSNRPVPGDPVLTWWPVYPRFFRGLFEQAFTAGLTRPAAGRVAEGVWRRSLDRLHDCVSKCSCSAAVFHDPDDPGLRCWNCGQVPPVPPLLELPGVTLVLAEGACVTSHHLHRDRRYDTIVGVVEAHPTKPGQVVLRNTGRDEWTATPDGEEEIKVPPRRRLGVRLMTISFGSVAGRIR
jgi:eukaryotic-like serine/threonine-protein kinase